MIDNNNFEKNNESINESTSIEKKLNTKENDILKNISNEYKIHQNNLEKLTNFNTSKWIEWLKSEIESKNIESLKTANDKTLENIIDAINKYQEKITNESKDKLAELKKETSVDEIINEESFIESKLSSELKNKFLENPETTIDHIAWWAIGILSSTEKVLKLTYDLWKWIITMPIDLYNIATKKAKYDKKI